MCCACVVPTSKRWDMYIYTDIGLVDISIWEENIVTNQRRVNFLHLVFMCQVHSIVVVVRKMIINTPCVDYTKQMLLYQRVD